MSEFVPISIAKKDLKGAIAFKVISLGELKSGKSKTGDPYQKMDVVIKDDSGAMNLTLWNDDIGKLEPGKFYVLDNAWWSEYKNDVQLSLGNYYELDELESKEYEDIQSKFDDEVSASSAAASDPSRIDSYNAGVNEKLDAVLHELDIIKGMVEPLFKKMVDDQIGAAKN